MQSGLPNISAVRSLLQLLLAELCSSSEVLPGDALRKVLPRKRTFEPPNINACIKIIFSSTMCTCVCIYIHTLFHFADAPSQ